SAPAGRRSGKVRDVPATHGRIRPGGEAGTGSYAVPADPDFRRERGRTGGRYGMPRGHDRRDRVDVPVTRHRTRGRGANAADGRRTGAAAVIELISPPRR